MKFSSPFLLLLSFFAITAHAQSESDWLFDDTSLPSIYITIDPVDLDLILENTSSDIEYPATFVFVRDEVSDTVNNIGFRIRGNTSRSSQKKSFKVSFDTFVDGREYRGLDKMNINGEHNDPSIIRSKLSWDAFEAFEVPAPRSNHVRLYINNEYRGLYINVEHIDNEFVEDRFGSDAGNLYKALYPSDLTFLGNSADDYKREENGRRIYELKTNEDEDNYSDIAQFIKFLEQASNEEFENEIRDYINVDGVLRVMAVDILTGMWDNYMFNKNNFYLYQNPATNRFEFIPFDYDNTFGIDWFGIDWSTRDINQWGSSNSRPLTDRLFSIQKYRDRLNYYIDKVIDEHFNTNVLYPEIDRLKAMIQEAAEEDTFRTLDYNFTIEDFNNSYTQELGAHVKSGLKGYISNRARTAVIQSSGNNIIPVIFSADTEVTYSNSGAKLTITTKAFDDDDFTITAYISGSTTRSIQLNDTGEKGDVAASDGIFTAILDLEEEISGATQIFVEAKDTQNQTERFPFNPSTFIEIEIAKQTESLFINEFMASNNTTIQDEFGDFEDWVEIYNPTTAPISMAGYYLTDDHQNPTKWAFPDTTIAPQSFLLVWTDDDEDEGALHTSFRLSRSGEDLGLFYSEAENLQTIDAFTFGEQTTDISFGRVTDGSSEFVALTNPTPGESNGTSTNTEWEPTELPTDISLNQNYPNPFNPSTQISFSLSQSTSLQLAVYSIHGKRIRTIAEGVFPSGTHSVTFNARELASGVYLYQLETQSGIVLTRKMTLLK